MIRNYLYLDQDAVNIHNIYKTFQSMWYAIESKAILSLEFILSFPNIRRNTFLNKYNYI